MSTATLIDRIEHLPESKRRLIEKMVETWSESAQKREKHLTFSWAGALADLRDKYTSIELQKEILNLWMPKR
jgi:hypothetical protein